MTQATEHVLPTIERQRGWRGADIFVLFVVFLGFAWLTVFLFFPKAYELTSFQVGPGLISYLDLYVGFLFLYLCFVLILYGRKLEIKIRRYSWILLLSFCWLSLLGFIMGNPPKNIFADWKRVWGLFAGVSLAILLQKSRFEPARIAVFVFGLIPLLLCSVAVTTGLGVISSDGQMGSIGLYVSAQVWATWLPILLCRLVMRQGSWLALPLALLGVSLVVPAQGTRAIALSVAVSMVGFFCWWLAKRGLKEQELTEMNETNSASSIPSKTPGRSTVSPAEPQLCDTANLEIEKRLRLSQRAILILLVTLLSCLALAVLSRSPRYSNFTRYFFSRLSKEDSIAAENIRIRYKEIQEMLGSMTGTNIVLGKGLGGTYYFSIADEVWVRLGLYTTPYLPAPHILIATLMLKGGLPFFLAGGVLFPLAAGWAFVSGILRRKKRYLLRLAPYDLAILGSFAMLFTSCHYDAMPLLAISMVISLRLIEGSKEESISGRLKQGRRARGERNT
jgi:hypothetical protein